MSLCHQILIVWNSKHEYYTFSQILVKASVSPNLRMENVQYPKHITAPKHPAAVAKCLERAGEILVNCAPRKEKVSVYRLLLYCFNYFPYIKTKAEMF